MVGAHGKVAEVASQTQREPQPEQSPESTKLSQKSLLAWVSAIGKYLILCTMLLGFYLMSTFLDLPSSGHPEIVGFFFFFELCKNSICFILKSRALMEN